MKQRARIAFLTVLVLVLAGLFPAQAADTAGRASEQIVILCTNDVHCETDPWKSRDGTVENLG